MTGSSTSGRQRSQPVIASFRAAISAIARRWYASWMSSAPRRRRCRRRSGGRLASAGWSGEWRGQGPWATVVFGGSDATPAGARFTSPERAGRACGAARDGPGGGAAGGRGAASASASRKSAGPWNGRSSVTAAPTSSGRAAPLPGAAQHAHPLGDARGLVLAVGLRRAGDQLAAVHLAGEGAQRPGRRRRRGPVGVGRHAPRRPGRGRPPRPRRGRARARRRRPGRARSARRRWWGSPAHDDGEVVRARRRRPPGPGRSPRARRRRRRRGRARGRRRRSARAACPGPGAPAGRRPRAPRRPPRRAGPMSAPRGRHPRGRPPRRPSCGRPARRRRSRARPAGRGRGRAPRRRPTAP